MLVAFTEKSDLFKVYGKDDPNEITNLVLRIGLADKGFIEVDSSVIGFMLN